MSKMSDSCKDHGQAVLVGHVNGVLVADRATWLDNSLDTCRCDFFHIISKWKKASDAKTAPSKRSLACSMAIRTDATRLVCPGPTPKVILSLVMMIPLDLTYLEDFKRTPWLPTPARTVDARSPPASPLGFPPPRPDPAPEPADNACEFLLNFARVLRQANSKIRRFFFYWSK